MPERDFGVVHTDSQQASRALLRRIFMLEMERFFTRDETLLEEIRALRQAYLEERTRDRHHQPNSHP
jgi:hypothetical protein